MVLGYSNEVGEAFRSIIGGKWVAFTYAVATIYVLADTTHKGLNCYKVIFFSLKDTFVSLLWKFVSDN